MRRYVVVYLALQVAAFAVLPLLSAFTASKVAELRAVLELLTVSRMLGHSSIRVTADVYSKVTRNLQDDAADAMQRAVG